MKVKCWHWSSALLSLVIVVAMYYIIIITSIHGYEMTLYTNNYGEALPEIVVMPVIIVLNIALVIVLCREWIKQK